MSKNKQARRNFIDWYFSNPTHFDLFKEELVNEGESNWTFNGILDVAVNVPEHIEQELKYADRLDDEQDIT